MHVWFDVVTPAFYRPSLPADDDTHSRENLLPCGRQSHELLLEEVIGKFAERRAGAMAGWLVKWE